MSDLTRRVLDAHAQNPDLEQDTPEQADAVYDLATAAPVLARQVEAVERRCAAMESEGGQPLVYAAALIRDALTEAAKEAPNE